MRGQEGTDGLRCTAFALPEREHPPTSSGKRVNRLRVPLDVPVQLWRPVLRSRTGDAPFAAAGMLVQKRPSLTFSCADRVVPGPESVGACLLDKRCNRPRRSRRPLPTRKMAGRSVPREREPYEPPLTDRTPDTSIHRPIKPGIAQWRIVALPILRVLP